MTLLGVLLDSLRCGEPLRCIKSLVLRSAFVLSECCGSNNHGEDLPTKCTNEQYLLGKEIEENSQSASSHTAASLGFFWKMLKQLHPTNLQMQL